MNRFRRMGFISYDGRIEVHKSLLNVILHDQFSADDPPKPGNGERRNGEAAKGRRASV